MNKNINFLILILLILNGCSKRTNINEEFKKLNSYSKDMTGNGIELKSSKELLNLRKTSDLDSITLNEAVSIALKNNNFLQTSFEDLGIAKADLEYAGLYGTNPHLESIIKFPKSNDSKNVWELEGSLPISNYWQVPLKNKVFKDELLVVTWGIASNILNVVKDIKIAYAECFFTYELIKRYDQIVKIASDLVDRIVLRKNYGLETLQNIYMSRIKYQKYIIARDWLLNEYNNKVVDFRNKLGIKLKNKNPFFVTNLNEVSFLDFDKTLLKKTMCKTNPDIYLAEIMINKYQDVLTLERSKFIKELNLGFSYERGEDGGRTFGPLLSMDIPIFDQNRGEVDKAKFLIRKMEKAYIDKIGHIKQQLLIDYNNYNFYNQTIKVYNKSLIPLQNKIENFTEKYFKKMQFTKIEHLNSKIELYLAEAEKIKKQKEKFVSLVNIERLVGKELIFAGRQNDFK